MFYMIFFFVFHRIYWKQSRGERGRMGTRTREDNTITLRSIGNFLKCSANEWYSLNPISFATTNLVPLHTFLTTLTPFTHSVSRSSISVTKFLTHLNSLSLYLIGNLTILLFYMRDGWLAGWLVMSYLYRLKCIITKSMPDTHLIDT